MSGSLACNESAACLHLHAMNDIDDFPLFLNVNTGSYWCIMVCLRFYSSSLYLHRVTVFDILDCRF